VRRIANSQPKQILSAFLLAIVFPCVVFSANNLATRRISDRSVSIELFNADPVAGLQFSVVTTGGIGPESFEPAGRLNASGIAAYQFRANDSTLNVVLLASPHSALPSGAGVIGTVNVTNGEGASVRSVSVGLNRIVACNSDACEIHVVSQSAEWVYGSSNENSNKKATLEPNYPNPFNPSTTISFSISEPSWVRLSVFDITGREIARLVDKELQAGRFSVQWNALSTSGGMIASGLYLARLQAGSSSAVQKMIVAK